MTADSQMPISRRAAQTLASPLQIADTPRRTDRKIGQADAFTLAGWEEV